MDTCCEKKISLMKTILWIWAVGATLFIAWQFLQNGAYRLGMADGQNQAIAQVVQQATKACQPFSIDVGGKQLGLINVECLQKSEDTKKK